MTMRSLHDDASRAALVERIGKLSPGSVRQWGKMENSQLLPHLADGLRRALGDHPPVKGIGMARFAPIRCFMIHLCTWPRGKIQAPTGAFQTPTKGWEEDREELLDLVEKFAETPIERLRSTHKTFGKMSGRDWDVLTWKHLDHHLTQFGV